MWTFLHLFITAPSWVLLCTCTCAPPCCQLSGIDRQWGVSSAQVAALLCHRGEAAATFPAFPAFLGQRQRVKRGTQSTYWHQPQISLKFLWSIPSQEEHFASFCKVFCIERLRSIKENHLDLAYLFKGSVKNFPVHRIQKRVLLLRILHWVSWSKS